MRTFDFIHTQTVLSRVFLDVGVGFYHHQMQPGEEVVFDSPVSVYSACPTVNILQSGRLKVTVLDEGIAIEKTASTGPLFEMYHPGSHLIEALEPSNYLCLSPLPDAILASLGIGKPTLHSLTIEEAFSGDYVLPENTRYVFPLYGGAMIDGTATLYGRCIELTPDQTTLHIETDEYCELVMVVPFVQEPM